MLGCTVQRHWSLVLSWSCQIMQASDSMMPQPQPMDQTTLDVSAQLLLSAWLLDWICTCRASSRASQLIAMATR
jgi:hypothetical protein